MIICVTNRILCTSEKDFFHRITELAKEQPHAIMLREKDLKPSAYKAMTLKVKDLCEVHNVTLIINQNIEIAHELGLQNLHLSMADMLRYKHQLHHFKIGASIHSIDEAIKAEELGASYLVAGHIYSTDCKKGVPPRGISFLHDVCHSVTIPVFGIGGITTKNSNEVISAGAKGICIMSEAMTCSRPDIMLQNYKTIFSKPLS